MSRLRKKQSSAGKSPLVATNIDQAYLLYMTMHDNKAPTASRFKKFINDDKRCQMPEIDFVTADHYLTSTGKGRTSASPSGTTYAHVMPKKKKRKKRKHDRSRTTSISASTSADPKKKRKKNKHYRQTNFDFTQESISNKSRPEVQLASLSEFSSLKPSKAKKHSRGKKTKRRGKRGLPRNHYRLQISTMLLIIFSSISLISAQNSSSYFDCSTQCNYDMYCVDGADCTVKCSADNSCRYGAIHPPNVGNLTVTCGPLKNTCRYMTLRGPMNGSFDLSCANVKSCENVDAICPIFGDCTVEIVSSHYDHAMTVNATNMISGGLYIAEIQRSTVQCPGNYLQCVINCTAAPCKSTSFHTKEDSILRIFASGASSLQSARVYSTLNTNYSIVVTDPVSDALSHFRLYSTDAMKDVIDKRLICDYVHNVSECYDYKNPPQLWCGSQYDAGCAMVNKGNNSWDCQNMTVSELCTSNETLSGYYGSQIVCSDSSECDYNMRCIDGEDCTVTCSGPHSCRYGALHPPNVGNLTVTCGPNKYSCHGTTLRAPMNGSFTLSCGGWVSCNYVYAFCPIFGDCTVEIVSSHYDHIMTVNASSMISGGLYIVEIQRSTVLCPGNYLECIANCTAAPCKSTSFYTQRDSSLSIFASGASSLQNANVYCALYANCSIIITQPVSDVLLHFKLYSIDAMNQRLICDYAHNASECYDYKDPPQLWCGSQYDTGCAMVNTGNNSWGCENMTFSELCTNNETLRGYYGSHILCKDGGECNYDMRCIDGEDCTVTCSGAGSCGSGTIHGPNAGNLTVTCGGGEYACHAMTLRGQMNGSLALSCAGHNTCGSVYAMCPIYGDCTVEVTYFHHTNPLTVDATNMTYGGLHVIELQSGTVKCPGNYLECVADCIAVPCTGTSFHTKNGSILTILSSGISSLQSVNIYCALNANCSITVDCGAQRSVVCDIESNTGPSYNEWRCNVPDSSHSINFTDLCVTADPTTNPSADPIIKPTADPTDTKLNTGTETSITITCGGSDCHFDEETAKVITNILIAYLDEDVQIIGTTITSNKVIIAIANADWDSLERDTISRDIKNELEDVDVSFDDAEDDEEIEHIKPNSDIFGDILEFLTSNIILGIIIGLALFLIIMAVGCVCWLLKKRKRAKIHQNMMTIPGVNVTDADIVPGATTQAKMHHLNMMEMPGTTTQADTVTPPIVPPLPPPTTRDYDEESINDKDTDDEADELYDVVFEDTKGGNTKDGNTKGGNTKGGNTKGAITAM